MQKKFGGGPKQLLVWCSLQDPAWWGDPVFEEIEQSSPFGDEIVEERRGGMLDDQDGATNFCNGTVAKQSPSGQLTRRIDNDEDGANVQGTSADYVKTFNR